jgi:phosphoenolpyruvate carboxylase
MSAIVPRCMSTQHPDNVSVPFFAETSDLGGEDEVREAYYAYSHIGCDEQMWDVEGKEVDSFVVKKLLSRYEPFFRRHVLGRELRLTLRVPNPTIERAEAKILLETLESIPRSYDAAHLFYDDDVAPIYEVILPLTASARCLDRIYRYYRDFIVGREELPFCPGDISVAEWIGEFRPRSINVIPLFEDSEHMLDAGRITEEYLTDKDVEDQRVFLARSDPAMNYGLVSAVLLNKLALARLEDTATRTGVRLHPILGIGSAPFRGGLTPQAVERVAHEYPSVVTFTIQSAFKYDHGTPEVIAAIEWLKQREVSSAHRLDEDRCLDIIDRVSAAYERQMLELADTINAVAAYVPSRRRRKLHIGLFGYSRNVSGVSLPRAISFTSALYSVGLPPELLGASALTPDDWDFLGSAYLGLADDMTNALLYCDPDCRFMPAEVRDFVASNRFACEPDPEHLRLARETADAVARNETAGLSERIVAAASIRRFLG